MSCGCIVPDTNHVLDLASYMSSLAPIVWGTTNNVSIVSDLLYRSGGTPNTNDAYGYSTNFVEGTACGLWEARQYFDDVSTNNEIYMVLEDEFGGANKYGWHFTNFGADSRRAPRHGTTEDFPIYYGPAGGPAPPDQVGYNVGFRFGIYYNNGSVYLYENNQWTNDTNDFFGSGKFSYVITGLPTDRRWRLRVFVFPAAADAHSPNIAEFIPTPGDVCAEATWLLPPLGWHATGTGGPVPTPAAHGVLMFDTRDEVKGWFFYDYAFAAVTGYAEEGVSTLVFGGEDGRLYLNADVDTDNEIPIACEYDTPWFDGGDPRSWKQFANGSMEVRGQVAAAAVADNATVPLGTTNVNAATRARTTLDFIQEEHRNLGLLFTGTAPIDLYNFSHEVTYVAVGERTEVRKSFATDLVMEEFGHVYRALICYISEADIALTITVDNSTPASYTLPSSAGATVKAPLIFQAIKGKLFEIQFQSAEDFQVIKDQTVFFVKEFRSVESYRAAKSFGDDSRAT